MEPTEDRISGDCLSEQAKKDSVCLLAELSKLIFRLMSITFWVQTTCIRTWIVLACRLDRGTDQVFMHVGPASERLKQAT